MILDFSRIPDQKLVSGGRISLEGGEVWMVEYFNELRDAKRHDEPAICRALIDAIAQERLRPYVFRCVCYFSAPLPPPRPAVLSK